MKKDPNYAKKKGKAGTGGNDGEPKVQTLFGGKHKVDSSAMDAHTKKKGI